MDVLRMRMLAILAAFIIGFFFYLHTSYSSRGSWRYFTSSVAPGRTDANSTLGFGALVAVSRNGSPRREDLVYAANLTGLDITIPSQPVWTEDDEWKFRTPDATRISHGSMLAWFGHLHALKWFLSTELETVLILEDDVDWDVTLRLTQIPLASTAFNQMLNTSIPTPDSPHYWSDLQKWEILYLGHCGDFFNPKDFPKLQHNIYDDPSVPPLQRLYEKTGDLLSKLGLRDGQRVIHHSKWPLCTFGYAVTRKSAQRILDTYSTEGPGGCQAYDVRILEACRDHAWLCYSANPELFHHVEAPSEIANVNEGVDDQGRYEVASTLNIGCGARSSALKTSDPKKFAYLKEMVGEKGMCLVDQMEEDRGRLP